MLISLFTCNNTQDQLYKQTWTTIIISEHTANLMMVQQHYKMGGKLKYHLDQLLTNVMQYNPVKIIKNKVNKNLLYGQYCWPIERLHDKYGQYCLPSKPGRFYPNK